MQEIIIHELRHTSKTFKDKDVYSFREKGPAPWLQKLCFKILRKLGCDNAIFYERGVERHVINPKSVVENLLRQQNTILQQAHDCAGVIYMGPSDFNSLAGETMGDCCMKMTVPYKHGTDGQFYGMDIIVVPWMKGVLVAPKHKNHVR